MNGPHNPVLQEGLVRRAEGFEGWREDTGRNDGKIADEFLDGQPGLPWCGGFIRRLFDLCGHPIYGAGPGYVHQRKALLSVAYMEQVFQEHHCWAPLLSDYQPQKGDVVFCPGRGGSDTGPGRHVGLLVSVEPDTRLLHCISGNWGNRVARHVLRSSPDDVTGFGWISV